LPLVELLAVLAAVAALWPAFERAAAFGDGRDARFAEPVFRVDGLPEPVLPAACAAHAPTAEAAVRERLCRSAGGRSAPAGLSSSMPPALTHAADRAAQAFAAPVVQAQARLDALLLRQREGVGELREIADAMASIEADIEPYLRRFQLPDDAASGPLPLHCAVRWVQAALAAPGAAPTSAQVAAGGVQSVAAERQQSVAAGSTPAPLASPSKAMPDLARGNAILLLAAALDGHPGTQAVAAQALLPVPDVHRIPTACAFDGGSVLAAAAALMGDARQSVSHGRKNEAMRALLQSAGWQWAGAMLLGFAAVVLSRHAAMQPVVGVAASLAAWAAAAWVARVPWPLAAARTFEPARTEAAWHSPPASFVLWLGAAAALLLAVAVVQRRGGAASAMPQAMSSRIGYAGVVLATGVGWLLLLDLSAHGHPVNRYLALYHQGHLWLGMLVFSMLAFLRRPLSHALGRGLSMAGHFARHAAQRLPPAAVAAGVALPAAAAVAAFGLGLSNMRQLTSELGRVWLILGAAWFFFLRAEPLMRRVAEAGPARVSFWRYAWPLLLVIGVLAGAMLGTRDMGPLLIAAYGAGAFVAAAVAMWWHLRSGHTAWAFVLAVALFSLWIGAVTVALFEAGPVDDVTAARLESLAAPLASTNDQLALVSWFQRAAPPRGFGLGAAPWCGYTAAAGCSGVPAQVHSDYTFTAIVGVFGASAAWTASLGAALWLHRLIRHHGRVTRGEPRLVAAHGRLAHDGQALLSWICVGWVVLTLCQLAVTVAGNLAVLPLTGVTFPFVSFGMTSLVVNLAFLALCLNVDLPSGGGRG
jgi:cell division protein FtsW (lipid II flippase)